MARFGASEAGNYGGGGNTNFFKLANDGDTALVRIMYDTADDIEGLSVHEIKIGDKKRYVNCLREYSQPIDDCPFCREQKKLVAKVFVPLYDVKEKKLKMWERGKKIFNKLSKLCSRHTHLYQYVYVIERQGEAGSTDTVYDIYKDDGDWEKVSLDELPEIPQVLGTYVLDKTAEDMEYFLEEEGSFPPTSDDDEEEAPVRRRSSKQNNKPSRRTPANSRRRRNDDEDDEDDDETY